MVTDKKGAINTLNESTLHKTLKTYYALQNEGSCTEVQQGSYIADILTKDGNIIEIQTANLSHLYDKIKYCIDRNISIKVVYPLVTTKYIETVSEDGKSVSKRKSPVHRNIYSIFRELTSLYEFLQEKLFTLEVLEVTVTETRQGTKIPVQTENKRRRFMKNWIKTDKRLEEIGNSHIFNKKECYLNMLPPVLPEVFTVKDIQKALNDSAIKAEIQSIRYMTWFFCKAGLIERCGTVKRCYLYKVVR